MTRRTGGLAAAALALGLIMAAAPPLPAQQAPAGPLAGLDAYIRQAMKDWGIAGAAVGVVKDDSLVFAGGYGVREAGKPGPVDVHTVFAIGSNTKLFTATLAGMLVDEGKLKWSDRAATLLPGFQLYDPYVTQQITLGDLLSHDSGLGRRGDLLWYASPYDRAEILRRIRYLKPITSFRAQFGYQNIMVMAAGEAVARTAGKSWDALVRERIFQPLGMSSSNTSVRDLAGLPDVASPHLLQDGKLHVIPWRDIDNIGPAGAINSDVVDMAQWLRLLLADGRYGGKVLIKPATLHQIEAPHTIVAFPGDTLVPSTHFVDYGYGVGMNDYLGRKVMTHTGGIDGMLSQVTWVPEAKLGIVVLTNTEGHNDVFAAIARRVLDAYLGAPPRDWSGILLGATRQAEAKETAAEQKLEAERPRGTHPSLPLDAYAGKYANEMYGDVAVALESGHLVARFGPNFTGDLEPWAYDSFRVTWRDLREGKSMVLFTLDPEGKVAALRIPDIDEFRRVPDRPVATAAAGAPAGSRP